MYNPSAKSIMGIRFLYRVKCIINHVYSRQLPKQIGAMIIGNYCSTITGMYNVRAVEDYKFLRGF
jgi:hypothetical protein